MDIEEQIVQEYIQALRRQKFDASLLDPVIKQRYHNLLPTLEKLDGNYYELFDMHLGIKVVYSQRLYQHLGFSSPQEIDAAVHPDDISRILQLGTASIHYLIQQPVAERLDYKMIMDYRIRKGNGWIRLTEQHTPVELDPMGNIWLVLSCIMRSAAQDINAPLRARIMHTGNGSTLLLSEPAILKQSPLSSREIEILDLIAEGLSSKAIAGKLFLSTHTVNTHRQNILTKLGAHNIAEALMLHSKCIQNDSDL